jgi:hypothetical protein
MNPKPLGSGTAVHVAPELLVAHIAACEVTARLSHSSPAVQHVDAVAQFTELNRTRDVPFPAATGFANVHVAPPSFVVMTSGTLALMVPAWTVA